MTVIEKGSHQQLLLHFFKNFTSYSFGIVLIRILALATLPLFWIKLEPSDFGTIGLTQILTTFLSPVLGFGLGNVIQRFYFEWDDKERTKHLGGLWTFSMLSGFLLCLLLEWIGPYFFSILIKNVPFDPYLRIAIWSGYFSNVSIFPQSLFRIKEQLKSYTQILVFSYVSQLTLMIVFVFVFNLGAKGYLLGALTNSICWSPYYFFLIRKELNFNFRKYHLIQPLSYAWPFVPNGILDGAFAVVDRFILDKFVPLHQIGLYTVAVQLSSVVHVSHNILKTTWNPFIFKVASTRKDTPTILSSFSVYYMVILAVPALAVASLSNEFINLFCPPKYQGVYTYIPYFALAYWFVGFGEGAGRGLDLAKKTQFVPLGALAAIIVNIICAYILIPQFQALGAAISFLLSFAARAFIQGLLANYFYPRPSMKRSFIGIFMFIVVGFFLLKQVQFTSSILNGILKVILLSTLSLFLFLFFIGKTQCEMLIQTLLKKMRSTTLHANST